MDSEETRTPECVDEFFRCLLQAYDSRRDLTIQASPPSPPEKDTIRFIANDQNNYREKYNGECWKLVCTLHNNKCTNFAVSNQLCTKHNTQRQKENIIIIYSPLYSSVPNNKHLSRESFSLDVYQTFNKDNYIKNKTTGAHTDNTIKSEFHHFKRFSIDSDDDDDDVSFLKFSHPKPPTDIEYIGSTSSSNELNITEFLSKNIPPLTSFEEIYLGNLLMGKYLRTCSVLDAQLYLHEEAIKVVKKNYQVQMNTISSEYFYDFLLRHPRIAIHYKNWFSRCKPIPPTTTCPIDTKIWTLSMIIRGTSTSDEGNDE